MKTLPLTVTLRRLIAKPVEEYLAATTKPSREQAAEIKALDQAIKAVKGIDPTLAEELRKTKADINNAGYEHRKREVAEALIQVARDLGVELSESPKPAVAKRRGQRSVKRPHAVVETERKRVVMELRATEVPLSPHDVAERIGLTSAKANAHLVKLEKNGRIQKIREGVRGRGGSPALYSAA